MKLSDFLHSLTENERDFIASLDYRDQAEGHRKSLDRVIKRNGKIDLENELWCPYEVIELGKNWLQDGHEREFVACAAIVLHNIIAGIDQMNDVEINMDVVMEHFDSLKLEHRELLQPLLTKAIEMDD